MQRDPYKFFRVEGRELLEQLGQGALALDKGGAGAAVVPRLLRLAHTLKGAARVVRQAGIAERAHAIEDALAPWREAAGRVPGDAVNGLLAAVDAIGAQLAALDAPAAAPGAQAAAAPDATGQRTLRADVAEIDTLRDGIAQGHAQIAALQRGTAAALQARGAAARLLDLLAVPAAPGGVAARALAEQLATLLGSGARTLQGATEQLDRTLRQVGDGAEQLRLAPAAALFGALERAARDAAVALGKPLQFEARGGDVRLDADLFAGVQPALVQLVRNALAHGIEAPAQRAASAKPAAGRVTISVERRGAQVALACSDDGAGFDLDAVRRVARQRGLLGKDGEGSEGGETLGRDALLALLLRGGVSTAGRLTEQAGRGVGLDVARDAVERLGGRIELHTEPGRGSTVTLLLPLALAAVDVLRVECAGRTLQIPLRALRRVRRIEPHDIGAGAQGEQLVDDETAIPFAPLAELLGFEGAAAAAPPRAAPGAPPRTALVIDAGGARAALGVTRLAGAIVRCVLQPLPAPLPAHPLIAGASLDVDGRPLLVLDAEGLVQAALRRQAAPAMAAPPRRPLLVVDDSLTTRMLEQSILESAGYDVHTAATAEDGLERARHQAYALFLVDVEMPGMDGFGFIETARADPQLRHVPAMLVTSRASAEDRRRGAQVGAQAYVVKGEFAQDDFLRHVRQLAGA
ncbi:response regulator [Aquincola sp. S2]|uniref:histidine kinase n=1 Tax=Pseudaquabacterium terrae TaxID=2732868 RepID=A0ABX2EHQ2_9BURK|nr:response regulator [Aquabacterium terrae]NRF68125.1 response regulator [Aquabacterium terrae]